MSEKEAYEFERDPNFLLKIKVSLLFIIIESN